ncbi:restriction endonuclease subunit S [Stenotrophomonas maltophilia]|nr:MULTISPECIES: restriction endonuclease subunit S [unclassified Stenotrophomonas]MBA0257560.1 restriction endonuclease subunit S [Stenotrophomonas maltophilia]MBA0380956.1 restriction endonuclease subunit S [Stenotrophomonas maltophilia]MBA0409485.1 restriction endonuclease subunit S [Stenotrophomonas maltophilia]MBA0427120.1 restriction endonuclease subunit S [Stenotrophomonas maltophilia]MBA0450757.1 restriction endonuclease subunit S [Stenotrophomonas maltophilia]
MAMKEATARYRLLSNGEKWQHTEIGPLPIDWQVRRLNELASIRTGIAKNGGAAIDNPVLVHYLRVANVQDGYLDLSEMSQLKVRAEDVKRYAVLPGDMLMNEGGDLDKLGRGTLWNGAFEPCVHQNHVFVVRCGSRLLPELLSAWTGSVQARRFFMLAGRQTTNLASINKTSLGQFPIPLPPTKGEQQAIAEALSDADALIKSLSLLLAKKRQIKQGAMQELLTGKKRLPGFDAEWVTRRLDQLADIRSGGTPSTAQDQFWNGDVLWCTPTDITALDGHKYLSDTARKLTLFGMRASAAEFIPANSIVMTSRATIGECAINVEPVTTNQGVKSFVPFEGVDIDFLYYLLLVQRSAFINLCSGSTFLEIGKTQLSSYEVVVPAEKGEQTAIAQVLSEMDEEIVALQRRLTKVRDLKQGMLQALLTGSIRLVQPASNVIPLPTEFAAAKLPATQPNHNWQINEAVVIGVLAQRFGSEKMPLGRMRRVKLTYLLHRHAEGRAEGCLNKAAGPYNPDTKYKGPEQVALKNGYVRALRNEKYEGLVAGKEIEQAQRYFEQWYGEAALAWLERFHYRKTEELELLATVDMAMVDLAASGELADVVSVKRIIAAHAECLPKLSRELFSDERIAATIAECQTLFGV